MTQDTNGIRLWKFAQQAREKKEEPEARIKLVKAEILDVMRQRGAKVWFSLSGKSLYYQVRLKLDTKDQKLIEAAMLQLSEAGILSSPPEFALTELGSNILYS